ncbi:MAG: hypothetical protein P8X90_30185 [Desulfobacterales bacterium]
MARISQVAVKDYLQRADNAPTEIAKGREFEDLICYLFEKLPGISVTERDVDNSFNSEEIDIVFWNEKRRNVLDFLPNIIFVECKKYVSCMRR